MENMVRAISKNGRVAVCALDSTEIVKEMERLHETSAVVSAGLGRLLTAASIMGSWLKNAQDSLTLRVDGGGPVGVMVAVSDGEGNVRGYATNPVVELPIRADGKLDVGAAVGHSGTLAVMKDLGLKEPYVGQVPLVSGEIAEDITAYYAASEQTPSVCALGVLVNADLSIKRAGGFLLQLLPGAEEADIAAVEACVEALPSVTEMLEKGWTPKAMAEAALGKLGAEVTERRTVAYRCSCSRERTRAILMSLGKSEIEKMQMEKQTAQVECHFCNRKYEFELDEITRDMQ
ncbi:MAG: Hsp33 family molecular chaperone HslO [Oscillospiraceae bacterium]